MRFGRTLRESIYPPWKDEYIDYGKLKRLLRDDEGNHSSDTEGGGGGGGGGGRGSVWTEEDENRFCDEIFNVQLEKVARFQEAQANALRDRADAVFEQLRDLTPGDGGGGGSSGSTGSVSASASASTSDGKGKETTRGEITVQRVRAIEAELDRITNDLRALKRYSSLNYTGFLKIVKKHDRKRGNRYKVRPMMQVSLGRRPFHAEAGYSPLLAKLSLMYEAVHQYLNPDEVARPVDLETQPETKHNGERYTAYKFWVHPDNLLEVKTMVLRHLPALVYSDSSAKEADATVDPTVTSLYFDNDAFELYNQKLDRVGEAESLRLRWYGQLAAKPELFLDEKVVRADGTSEEHRITIKDKYVRPFLDGAYAMEKSIQKMERQGEQPAAVDAFRRTAAAMQTLVREKRLEPLLRANYVRTAFQKPADDRVRVSIDTNLAFVREDNLDPRHPCRDPAAWHRRDIDALGSAGVSFANLPPSDVSQFPYAVLEIKLREDVNGGGGGAAAASAAGTTVSASGDAEATGAPVPPPPPTTRKRPAWVEDLMASHLVYPSPHFSKFVHGAAVLFDDYVNRLPFWLGDVDRDIRRDPQEAFAEEELRRAQRAADKQVVGSFLGTTGKLGSFSKPARGSPATQSATNLAERLASEGSIAQRIAQQHDQQQQQQQQQRRVSGITENGEPSASNGGAVSGATPSYGTISSVLPSFSVTRYAKWRRRRQSKAHGGASLAELPELPEGVTEPTEWLKNAGPLHIEPKVWLANERTFLKWMGICILLGSLAVALSTAAVASGGGGGGGSSSSSSNTVAAWMGVIYIGVAAFAGFWGWYMLETRRAMIIARSGRDFDNMVGPVVVSVALMGALILNLVFAYRAAFKRWSGNDGNVAALQNNTRSYIHA
ncbi:spx domain containing protein [Niveomyces insectorum RCEF 264]|uniref:Spx domain containing protein n=1 Tax=Niveomyces insectorum RCEF 264 TaxID=1081102 RepID=A0A162JER1_9HYPO|nr:spx domain containing protein [Niveomyces insectorum RCEF 264]